MTSKQSHNRADDIRATLAAHQQGLEKKRASLRAAREGVTKAEAQLHKALQECLDESREIKRLEVELAGNSIVDQALAALAKSIQEGQK